MIVCHLPLSNKLPLMHFPTILFCGRTWKANRDVEILLNNLAERTLYDYIYCYAEVRYASNFFPGFFGSKFSHGEVQLQVVPRMQSTMNKRKLEHACHWL